MRASGVALAALWGASACTPAGSGAAAGEGPAVAEPRGAASAEQTWPERGVRRIEHCASLGYEICFNAQDDNCNGVAEEGCGIPTGVIQFLIAWDGAKADVDLNVVDPNGELIEGGKVSKSGLVKERDCPGRRQECRGKNLENVFLE